MAKANALVITGDLKQNYQILDTIFALGSNKEGIFSDANPTKAFEDVKDELAVRCVAAGGNAVINCQFEYRIAIDGKKRVVEIFAYGTAVKLV